MTRRSSSTKINSKHPRGKNKSSTTVSSRRAGVNRASKHGPKHTSKKINSSKQLYKFWLPMTAVVVLLIGFALILVHFSSPKNTDSTMSLELSATRARVGEPFVVKVYADSAQTKVNAVGAGLAYADEALEVTSISSKNSAYPIEAVQKNTDNSVKIVRGVIGGNTGKKLVAEVTFVAKTSGKHTIAFAAEDTNLVASDSNENIVPKSQLKNVTVEAYEQ